MLRPAFFFQRQPFVPTTLFLSLFAAAPGFGALIHDYELDGSLADSLGGPALVASGGTLTPTEFAFGVNEGLILSNALPNPAEYSILVDLSIAEVAGYRRLVDFKDNTSDTGVYNLGTALNFFDVVTGAQSAFAPNVPIRLVLTRDATTELFSGYINGNLEISFLDTGNLGVFSETGAIIKFFIDDLVVSNEASAGTVSKIAIYDAPLSAGDAANLGGPDPVPEPGSALLGLTGLAMCLSRRRRG